ncbi:UDP-glucose 4-epimerase [Cognatiyoonia sediminum]|uniref:UDP-glucose 4-epimerase n=1 Tax=Cognatiyoonia sediminum TaxID=1508389 RepID=A0A1M5S1T3_9RHOB|nr:UDP-glucose 4-epimerase GalE [Cognatiyoonia sediminum]SHH32371.1 UDP-glucose 4-epimerase [Cognatiyoonia sediminum]
MRVLVTGGAGYIGSHTLVELLGQAHEVQVIDNFDNSSPEVLSRVRKLTNGDMSFAEGDVRDDGFLRSVFEDFQPDQVVHFAGLKAVGESMEKPLEYYDVNVRGTMAILRAMDSVGCRKIVFSSSATVYGEPVYLPYDEDHPVAPESVYGRTKMIAEHIIGDWAQANGGTAVLLRYFNPVGAHSSATIGEHPQGVPNNLMPFVAQVASGKRERLSIFGDDYDTPDGTGRRDYIHVVDLACAHVAAVNYAHGNTGTRHFNVGTGQSYSVREMVAAFEKASGREIPCVVTPRRKGDIAEMKADASRAKHEMGWEAKLGLADMAASTWEWQSNNPDGYEK